MNIKQFLLWVGAVQGFALIATFIAEMIILAFTSAIILDNKALQVYIFVNIMFVVGILLYELLGIIEYLAEVYKRLA